MKPLKKAKKYPILKRSYAIALAVVLFALIGTVLLYSSRAATNVANTIEPESDSLSGAVTSAADTNASKGGYVTFTAAPTQPPTSTRSLNCTPPASGTMTNKISSECGFPDTTTTGPVAGTTFKRVPQDITSPDATTGSGWHYDSRGWIAVDTDGAVIKNVSTALNIDVTANNVTVQNNKITYGGEGFGVSVRHASNTLIKNNQISGTNTSTGRLLVAIKDIYGDETNTRAIANNIYYVSTGIQIDSGVIQDNYIHDMGLIDGDHINGTTSNGGTSLLTISHNTSFNQFSQTDAISLFEDFGVQANKVIDNNLVAGGGYCIYGGQNVGGAATYNIKITNNHFSRLYYPGCGSYGHIAAWNATGSGNVWSGNIWDDTGANAPSN